MTVIALPPPHMVRRYYDVNSEARNSLLPIKTSHRQLSLVVAVALNAKLELGIKFLFLHFPAELHFSQPTRNRAV